MLYLYITTNVSSLKTYLPQLSFSREKIKINLIFRQEKKAVVLHFLRSLLCEIRITWHMDFNVFVWSRETNTISYIGMSDTSDNGRWMCKVILDQERKAMVSHFSSCYSMKLQLHVTWILMSLFKVPVG